MKVLEKTLSGEVNADASVYVNWVKNGWKKRRKKINLAFEAFLSLTKEKIVM